MFYKSILGLTLTISSLFADDIISFTADKTTASPGDVVNLTIDYSASQMYELHFSSYIDSSNTKLDSSFSATDLKHYNYTVPSDADYAIRIEAELIEERGTVATKQIVLDGQSQCQVYVYVTRHGLYDVADGCSCEFYESRPGGSHRHINVKAGCQVEVIAGWHNCCPNDAKTLLCTCSN